MGESSPKISGLGKHSHVLGWDSWFPIPNELWINTFIQHNIQGICSPHKSSSFHEVFHGCNGWRRKGGREGAPEGVGLGENHRVHDNRSALFSENSRGRMSWVTWAKTTLPKIEQIVCKRLCKVDFKRGGGVASELWHLLRLCRSYLSSSECKRSESKPSGTRLRLGRSKVRCKDDVKVWVKTIKSQQTL